MNIRNNDLSTLDKKALKDSVKKNGFHLNMPLKISKNAPDQYASAVPEGAIYFEGIASDGELNRNGYIIRENAWAPAIEGYMQNPIILLQHNADQPIGACLWAKVTDKGLEVGGYVYDADTANRFSKGLFRALSTGHYTLGVEFQDKETGAVITDEEFRAIEGWGKYDKYILCVTALEWIEFSVVSIGSNRKSMVTHKNAILNYFKNEDGEEPTDPASEDPKEAPVETPKEEEKKVEDPKPEEKEEEKGAEEDKEEEEPNDDNTTTPDETGKESEKADETPAAPSKEGTDSQPASDGASGAETKPKEEKAPEVSLNGLALGEIQDTFKKILNANKDLAEENVRLTSLVNNTPVRKSFATLGGITKTPAKEEKKTSSGWFGNLLKAKGITP